jgi:hypothetical protein
MHRIHRASLLACLLAAAIGSEAAGEPFSLARLREVGQGIATLRLPFTQEKHLALFDEPVISAGVIEISRPLAAVRWEYTGRSVLVLSEGRVRRWGGDGVEEDAGADAPGTRAARGQMQALLSGDWSALEDLFTVTPDPGGAATLTLTPRSPDLAKYIATIAIAFAPDLSAPRELAVVAADGDRTLYRFGEAQRDVALPASRFTGP